MASLSMSGSGGVSQVAGLLCNKIQESGLSCRLVDSVHRSFDRSELYVMVFEKYYFRASNRASLTVAVSGGNGFVDVDAIGSGGGQGPVFKFSWGAEESFVGTVEKILRKNGFR